MAIRNLNKLLAAKENQMNQMKDKENPQKEKQIDTDVLKLMYDFIKANNQKMFDMLRAVQDNQKILDAKLVMILKWIKEQEKDD